MPTYISLFNWTEQGIRNFRDTVDRVAAAEEALAKLGVTLKEIYWTLGMYDAIAVAEAPDDETVSAALLALGAGGNARSVTLRAFDREEMARVIEKAG